MPIHLPTVTRRRFLVGSAGAMAGLVSIRSLQAAGPNVDPNSFALLSDTHVAADANTVNRGIRMADHCRSAVGEVLEMTPRPAAVMINGDAAYLTGEPGDYRQLSDCLAPLAEADVPVHVTMGNHDDRGPFYDVMTEMRPEQPPLIGWHVGVVETDHANWIMIDSLDQVNVTPGLLGEDQLNWLAKILDTHDDKPAILYGHHYPQWKPRASGAFNGLKDTEALFDVLKEHPQVKAYFFGHSHRWDITEREGVHLINLPAVGYVFAPTETSAWVHAQLKPNGMDLTYQALNKDHDYHEQQVTLDW
ncbi:MAG: metallophosphoesterase [Phycisphaeraceae bacterium]